MATQRQYESATIFNARIVDMRHLWEPSREYKGQQTQKPNYFSLFIIPKTQAHWSNEPAFAGVMAAFGKLLQGQLQAFAQNPNMVQWPIMDGDMPSPEGKVSEFAKGHWLFSASTGNPPNIEIVQPGGVLAKLNNKLGVKSGDFVLTGVTAAVKQNQANGVKFYLNAVVFSGPGEEIVFANSVSGAELVRMAQQQGLQPAGFSGSPGFGGVPQGGGFGGGGFQPNAAPQGGFNPGAAPAGGFTPGNAGGFAPTQGGPAPQGFASAPNGGFQNGQGGNGFASPSNGGFQPPPNQGGFNPGQGATPFGGQNSTTTYPSNQGGFNPGQR